MLRPIAFVTGVLFLLMVGSGVRAEVLVRPASGDAGFTAEQTALIEHLKSMPATRSIQVVTVNPSALDGTDETTVFLTESRSATFKGTMKEPAQAKDFTWSGEAALGDLDSKSVAPNIFLSIEDGQVSATIRTESELFQVRPIAEGIHVLIDVDVSKLPPDHGDLGIEEPEKDVVPWELRAADDRSTPVIRVLVLITPRAKAHVSNLKSFAKFAIDEANTSYTNSSIRARLELADAQLVSYTESGNQVTDLARLTSKTDGFMDGVHLIRDTKKADVVVLLLDDNHDCGRAKVGGGASYAFAVNWYYCTDTNLSLPHEIGHIMGACHDPDNSSSCPTAPYAHGYRNIAERRRTIMAYPCPSPTVCTRQMQWSRPPNWGRANLNYNAKVLDDNAPAVSRFR